MLFNYVLISEHKFVSILLIDENKTIVDIFQLDIILLLLSIYSPISVRVGLPLHSIPSPFLSGHLRRRSQLLPYLRLHSLTMSLLVFCREHYKLHTFLHPVLITCSYLIIHPSQSFTCVSVLYGDTTHPSDDQRQEHSLTSIRHAASDTTDIHSTVHLQWGSSGCQK